MSRDGTQLAWNLEPAEHLDSLLHDWEVGATTAHDPDSRNLRLCGHADPPPVDNPSPPIMGHRRSSGEQRWVRSGQAGVHNYAAKVERAYAVGVKLLTSGRICASISASVGPQSTFATSHDSA